MVTPQPKTNLTTISDGWQKLCHSLIRMWTKNYSKTVLPTGQKVGKSFAFKILAKAQSFSYQDVDKKLFKNSAANWSKSRKKALLSNS
jgi:hypothetical protein